LPKPTGSVGGKTARMSGPPKTRPKHVRGPGAGADGLGPGIRVCCSGPGFQFADRTIEACPFEGRGRSEPRRGIARAEPAGKKSGKFPMPMGPPRPGPFERTDSGRPNTGLRGRPGRQPRDGARRPSVEHLVPWSRKRGPFRTSGKTTRGQMRGFHEAIPVFNWAEGLCPSGRDRAF